MRRRLDGRAVLITRAGSGIGRATVLRVAAWDSVLAVNLTGTVRTVVASLPYVADGASNSELRDDSRHWSGQLAQVRRWRRRTRASS